jgi:integrase
MPGEGTIFKRVRLGVDGRPFTRYVAQLSTGPREHRRRYTRVELTRAAARAALAEMQAQLTTGTSPSSQPLGSYLRSWLDDTARPSIAPNTYRGYHDMLAHLTPIADVPVALLTPEDIERALNLIETRRGKVSQPASPKTVRNVQVMLRAALGSAERRGHIARNPARLVPLRRVPRRRQDAMTPDMARAVLAAVAGDRYEAAYALGLTGLRVSEVLGLAWSDVDLSRRVVEVRYQLVGSGPSARRAQLKTAASEAPVALPLFAVERLREHRARQDAERPVIPLGGGLVFVTERGYAVNGSWLTKHFQQLLKDAGLPRLRLHDLRHGASDLLAEMKAHPRVAQEYLRHASSKTTMEVYTHTTRAQMREAADLLDVAIGGRG